MMSRRSQPCEAAVVGAGPYGLSVAAHLRRAGIATRVFGEPMGYWRHNMPNGMVLRSPWRASHLSSPDDRLALDVYQPDLRSHGERRLPLKTFVAYGEWFQSQAAPEVDRRMVRLIGPTAGGFCLTLEDGEVLTADRVVIATGLRNQEHRPEVFGDLPAALVSHCCDHVDLSVFRGKRVAVIGGGQSACESAVLLSEAGAETELISRKDIHWLAPPRPAPTETVTSQLRGLLKSPSEVGPFPLSWLAEVPALLHAMPATLREEITERCLRPAAAGWLKPRTGKVKFSCGEVTQAKPAGDRVVLDVGGTASTFDHVLLGTGYRIDIARLGFLLPQLVEKILRTAGSPILATGFESSVPRLHFVGSYAVRSYGPLLRFVAGASFAARSVAAAILSDRAAASAAEFSAAVRLFESAAAASAAAHPSGRR